MFERIPKNIMKHIRSSSLVIFAIIGSSLTSCQTQSGGGAPITPGMEPTVLNASPSEAAQTQRLWANTLQSISRAKQSLEANDANAQRNLAFVFGSTDDSCRQEVLKHIRLMDNKARSRKYTISLFEGSVAGFEDRVSVAAHTRANGGAVQLTLFGFADHPVIDDLKRLKLDTIAPMEALQILHQAQRAIAEGKGLSENE